MDHDGPNIIFSSGGLVDLSVAKNSDFLLTFHNFQQKIFFMTKVVAIDIGREGRWANSHSHSRQSAFIGVTIVIIIPKQPDTRAHVSKYTVAIIIIDKHHRHDSQTDTDIPPFAPYMVTIQNNIKDHLCHDKCCQITINQSICKYKKDFCEPHLVLSLSGRSHMEAGSGEWAIWKTTLVCHTR